VIFLVIDLKTLPRVVGKWLEIFTCPIGIFEKGTSQYLVAITPNMHSPYKEMEFSCSRARWADMWW
jgi:hypothetical protein